MSYHKSISNLAFFKSLQALDHSTKTYTKAEVNRRLETTKAEVNQQLEAKADRFSGYSGEVAIGDKRLRFENGILKGVS